MHRLKVLILGSGLDGTDLGEVYSAFRWVEALTDVAEVTVLASTRAGRVPLEEQLPGARVITWTEPSFLSARFERFNAMVKPALPLFFRRARSWIRDAVSRGERFDIAHQFTPQAMRYACPLKGLGIPYVIGPLGGGLTTPQGFASEVGQGSLLTRLRAVDDFRIAYDPWLRSSYAGAELILGVAPYVREKLAPIPLKRFESVLERGHGAFPPAKLRQNDVGRVTLLHVGRCIRTKALRDVVRAMAKLRDLPNVRLISAGDGEDLYPCRQEADILGVADRITFHGRIPREEVEKLYKSSDIFCFPSFREPMGGVFFEAMAHGLPVIAAARGGPEFIIDDTCGMKLPATEPDQFCTAIADAVRTLANDPDLRLRLGSGSRDRLRSFGSWHDKAQALVTLYNEALSRIR